MILASLIKMPVSSTHSIIGALFGFQLLISNFNYTKLPWGLLAKLLIAWLVTPLMGFMLSYLLMFLLNKYWFYDYISMNNKDMLKDVQINNNDSSVKRESSYTPTDSPKSPKLVTKIIKKQTGYTTLLSDENSDNNINDISLQTIDNDPSIEDSKTNTIDSSKDNDNNINISTQNSSMDEFYSPQPWKFGCIMGILLTTIILFILISGPKSIQLQNKLHVWQFFLLSIATFIVSTIIAKILEPNYRRIYIKLYYSKYILNNNNNNNNNRFNQEDYFRILLIISSGVVAFAHGGNDVANVLGPFGEIYLYTKYGNLDGNISLPIYITGLGGIFIALGFYILGKPVLETIGKNLTKLDFRSGFIAQYTSSTVVLICDTLGLPVSSTTVIVGAVTGVGYFIKNSNKKSNIPNNISNNDNNINNNYCDKIRNKLKSINFRLLFKIISTWIITIPVNAVICMIVFKIFAAANKNFR